MVRNFARVGAFEPLYAGPYSIVDKASPMVYAVQLPRKVRWYHANQCKLFDPTRAGKKRVKERPEVVAERAPGEATPGEGTPDSTAPAPVAACRLERAAPEVAVPGWLAAAPAPSQGTVRPPEPAPVGKVACLSREQREAEETTVSPLAWEARRYRRGGRTHRPPVKWSPEAPGPRRKRVRVGVKGKRGTLRGTVPSKMLPGTKLINQIQFAGGRESRAGRSDPADDWPQNNGGQF